MQPVHLISSDSARTLQAIAARLAKQLKDGDVLLLTGDMGAGKSEFCRGLARGLGIKGSVPSPSFTILNLYEEGRLPFKHFDWYRVADQEELLAAGLDELIGPPGITAIEWHQRAPALLPEDCLEVRIAPDDADGRLLRFQAHGSFRALDYDLLCEEDGAC